LESVLIIKAISLFDFALNGGGAAKLPPYYFEILLVESPDDDGWTVLNDSAELGTFDNSPTTMKRLTLGGVVSLTINRRTVPINEVI